jgi:ribosomal protein S18 acetylase RimI-like enzyme
MKLSIRSATADDVPAIVRIYMQELPGFLRELGEDFLVTFYTVTLTMPQMFTYVALSEESVVGFVSNATDVKGLNAAIIKTRPIHFFGHILLFILKHPIRVKKIFDSFLYPGFSHRSSELLTIAIDSDFHGKGIGKQLFDASVKEFQKRGVKEFLISAYDRLPANGFYKKLGCTSVKSFEFLGEQMNYYKFLL